MTETTIGTEELGRVVAQGRFSVLYREHGRAILAYALRRTGSPEDAADAVAETFLVAWRRLNEVPIGEARLWLYGVARRVIANQDRAERRRTALGQRLSQTLSTDLATHAPAGAEAAAVLRAMAGLRPEDRELLLLVSWEDLTPAQAAKVLGISALAARSRLHRARRRLRTLLADDESISTRSSKLDMEEAR
jgi:RNA polymerase sigma-70 factor (ECF subfamily)